MRPYFDSFFSYLSGHFNFNDFFLLSVEQVHYVESNIGSALIKWQKKGMSDWDFLVQLFSQFDRYIGVMSITFPTSEAHAWLVKLQSSVLF